MKKGATMTGSTQQARPTFVLGVGAQKAGTTWLQAYLDHFVQSDFGEIKEYHVWDALTLPLCADYDARSSSQPMRRRLRGLARRLRRQPRRAFEIRQDLQRDPERYFDYFERILARPGIAMTGDITPSYCGLDVAVLEKIRDGFMRRGIDVRAVFLMREPVERSLSAIRMFRRNGVSREGVDITLPDAEILPAYLKSPHARMRNDYIVTISALEAAFEPGEIYVGVYEAMFTDTEFDRLNAFFGLEPRPAFRDRSFNTTKAQDDIPQEIRQAAMAQLEQVYSACFSRDPGLRALWPAGAEMVDRLSENRTVR